MTPSPVFRGLLNTLCLGRNRLFAMLYEFGSFADEFGPAKGLEEKRFAGIAGLMASSERWRVFSEKWEQLFADEKIPRPFSMKDFVFHNEEFHDKRWEDQQERIRILNLLFPLIEEADVVPVGASVFLKDYWALEEKDRTALREPYYVAFQEVTSNIAFAFANLVLSGAENEEELHASGVSMVYAKLKKFTGPAEGLWNEIKDANMYGHWMSSYTPGEPVDYPPLQAADIWAYALGRLGEQKPMEEARLAFDFFGDLAFKAGMKHGGRFFSLLDKKEMLIRLGKFGELHI